MQNTIKQRFDLQYMTHTMNMTYRSKKQITKLMASSSQLLTILMSKLRVCLEYAWEQVGTRRNLVPHEITARPSRDYVSSGTTFLRPFSSKRAELERRFVVSMLLFLMVGVNGAWGLTGPVGTDYSGTYYIANYNDGNYSSAINTDNFYLCPASNYFDGDGEGKKNQPFLTTHKPDDNTGKETKPIFTEPIAKWEIEFATTGDDGVDYYYIKFLGSDGNEYYIVHNDQIVANNKGRVRVHLQTTKDEDEDKNLFFITQGTLGDKKNLNLCPKVGENVDTSGKRSSLNPAKANMDSYSGQTQSNPGSFKRNGIDSNTIYCGGLVGYWTTDDKTGVWYLEDVKCKTPVITYSSETGKVTITSATEGATIHYTTDGSNPTSSSTSYNDTPFDLTSSITTIKAIAVKSWTDNSDVATVTHVLNPTITLTIPDGGYTYDKTEKEPEVSLKDGETTISSSEYQVSYNDNINAGNTATVTISDAEGGEYIVYGSTTFTIAPKALTVTADAKSKGYGDTDPELTYTATELVEGDVLEGTLSRAEGENVGTYAISQGTLANSNYSINFTGADLTITPKSLGTGGAPAENITIDVDNDGNNYIVTVKQGEITLIQGTDYTWTGSGDEFEYTVTVTGIGNYSGTAQATYVAATPGYYVLHQNGKGYLKVSGAGVNLENDGTFQSGNLFDKGNCIWYMTPEGYLQNEYFYLNAANNNTLYLSVNPVTRWRSEDVTGENTYGKKHLKINNGTEDLYLCNDNNSITLKNNPSAYYSACPVDVEEVENSWAGPTAENLTVQSPQLVTYLRAYFTQKIKYTFHNDAGAEVKSTDGKHERRVYATIAYKEGGNNKGTDWDIDESGILYNKKASGDVEFTATYNILPADPVVRAAHSTPASNDIKYKVTKKPLTFTENMDYLLYSISGGDSYRYPYDDGIADGGAVKPDGKGGTGDTSVLTDPDTDKNLQISWKITADEEGFYTFQNSSTNKYLYYDEAAHTSSDFGVLRLSSAPTGNSAKFRLYKTSDTNYSECYYLIPYSKLFAVYKSNAVADGLYVALNNKDYTGDTPVISLSKPNANSTWCIYKYEAEYRIREDFTITGPSSAEAVGNYDITSEGWYGRYIKQSPRNGSGQRGLVIKGTYKDNVDYIWTVTGLGNYINISDGTNTDGTWSITTNGNANNRKLVVNVTSLPVSTTSGVITLKLSGYSAPNTNVKTTSEKTFAFTILGDGAISFTDITSLAGITSSSGAYRLVGGNGSNFAYSDSNKPGITTFSGVLDGNNQTISGLNAPLFDNLSNGTVRNVNLSGVGISNHSGPTGAIAGTADGGSRIYNVGILDGEVGSNGDVCGGLVGKLDGSARVINCFSYATITGGTTVGGIVGNNTYASKSNDMRTMVMNCMFYGDITGGNSKAPIYNGQIITNRSDENGVGNFNYFWAGASYVQGRHIDVYNCALSAETRFLQRFEFFRHLLNSNRALAAWWATGSRDKKNEMLKWVLEPSQIGTAKPYPILKPFDKYPSVVNIDADHAEDFSADADTKKTQYNQGRKFGTLTINIQNATSGSGSVAPSGANITTLSVTPNITDKDPAHFNFNYYKVQLPYYNDVGTKNYTDNKVVTGWKIVTISGGTNTYSTDNDNDATTPADATASIDDNGDITLTTPYNFADRKCTDKDKFEVSGRVFSQGAYFDVPEGVSSITIEPYWGKCVYVSDQFPDVVYNQGMSTAANVTTVGGGQRYTNNTAYDINGSSQKVYTTMGNAVTALNPSGSVYDNAIVLVGNVHSLDLSNKTDSKPYTIMSIDLDSDNEPDYSYILRFNSRNRVHPVRIDFLNVIGLGMAQKSKDGTGTYNFGIMQPFGWFECTNTGLFRVTQLEYDYKGQNGNAPRLESPMILQGGVIEQWVTVGGKEAAHKEAKSVTYYHVGGNVWFKEFHIGVHQDKTENEFVSPHPPISVTGGDFDEFYLTGMYNTPNTNYPDNAECYINGGRFGKVAGTGMQGLGNAGGAGVSGGPSETGNIIWQIDNADIDEFYAGGINAAHIATGNIRTVISNSRVDQFCGGPKFGNMTSTKTVVTNATNCTFRTFFGAGYGGNSYNRRYPFNRNDVQNTDWNGWVSSEYTNKYDSNYGGVETRIDYQFIPMSNNNTNVARLYVDYVNFSLATTYDVTSKLTDCTITTSTLGRLELFSQSVGNFYGGGSLGMVAGPVKSTLTNCTVEGNVFGGGYSATLPTVAVMDNSFQTPPYYDSNLGAYLDAVLPNTVAYTWEHATESEFNTKQIDTDNHILYTTETLTGLGAVTGNVTLTIDGNTTLTNGKRMSVSHSVYGGGEESNVGGNTQVNITGGTITENVFGGGKGEADEFSCSKAMVGDNNAGAGADLTTDENKNKGTTVTISNGQVNGNVYGGGEVGRVEWNTQVKIGVGTGNGPFAPVINGSVFGAGKGKDTHGYAALVRGNSTVTIQGKAKVLQNVYGGGEQATVGRYWVKGINNVDSEGNPIPSAPSAPTDMPDEMPYKTMSGGKCTVVVQGSAQVGPDSNVPITAGHVFGAGKGVTPAYVHEGDKANWSKRMVDYNSTKHTGEPGTTWDYYPDNHAYVWEYFTTEDKYLEFLQTLALVTGTDVTIGGGTVKGSVFGGSESGFVQDDTKVKIQAGTIGTSGTTTYGNVFGGGKGLAAFAEAGKVKGNTEVEISGGTAHGNVYGGGELGDVGTINKADIDNYTWSGYDTETTTDDTGKCKVSITNAAATVKGDVFGAGKGSGVTFQCEKAMAYNTEVTISAGTVNGNVYGGGEVGRVENNTKVKIGNGDGSATGTAAPVITKSVFGAGKGLATHGYSALVRGNTEVTVEGNASIGTSVYGGGEIASVGRYGLNADKMPNILLEGGECKVTIQGYAVVGPQNATDSEGNVFGAGRGVDTPYDNSNKPQRMTLDNNGQSVLQTINSEEDYKNFLETLALATAPDVTIDGNATVNGSVFGGGELGLTKGGVIVKINGGTIGKDVYGGGALAHTNTTNQIGSKDNTGAWVKDANGNYVPTTVDYPTTTVRLLGGTIRGEAYGGALGQKNGVNGATSDIAAYVYGDVLLDLNGTTSSGETGAAIDNTEKGCVVGQVFGCNNINGTPKGNVMVHVYATQNKQTNTIAQKFILEKDCNTEKGGSESDAAYVARLKGILTGKIALAEALSITVSQENKDLCTAQNPTVTALTTAITSITTSIDTKTTEEINAVRYDVEAVYGGGNMAAYVPVTPNTSTTSEANGSRTQVIIEGCEKTSIETVYGGGNAAAVPETNVVIKGAYEIGYLFGGGNGKDKILINNVLTENPGADIGQYHNGTQMVTYGTGNANSRMEAGLIHEAYGGSNTKGVLKGSINQVSAPKDSEDPSYCCELVLEKIVGAGKYADIDGDVNMTLSCQPSSKVPLLFAGADEANVNGNITLNITNGNFGKVFGGNNLGGAVKGKITVNVEETGCQPIKIDELYLGGNEAAYSIYGYYEETQTATGKKILKPRTSADDSHTPAENPTGNNHTFPYAQPELNIISCTYIGNVFGGGYGEGAVMYANPTVNVNLVPGRYADGVPEMMNSLGLSADAYANPNNVGIIRNVYGGGNAANVEGNTTVNIATEYLVKEVTVGDDVSNLYTRDTNESYTKASGTAQANVTYYEKSYAYIIGSVFGGGNAADVLGNTNVTMSDGYVFNGIFGGGYAGNVGTFTERSYTEKTYAGNIEFDHSTHNDCIGKPTKCKAGTGKCTVLVNGGQIGPYTVATLGMNRKDEDGKGIPVPEGWVWGAGQGLVEDPAKEPDTHFKSYVGSTDVTIGGTAFVLESIIGGGEFGRVLGDTKVTITGNCQIGVGAGKVDANTNKPIRYNDADFINPSTAPAEQINAKAALMPECSHFPYGEDTNNDGIKDRFLPYDPYYDDFKETTYITDDHPDLSLASSSSPTDGKTWIGCVFAGGSGYMPYLKKDNDGNDVGYDWCSSAGLVEGNTNLTISGGHILTNVYGGNEYTNVKGKCKVTMTSGTIGVPRTVQQIIDHPLTCYLFGAGKGDPRPHFNTETNVGEVEINISGGIIYGSVFGGGEDGHVERNVKMTIGNDDHSGPVIGTWGTTYVDGNIFGGGRGFAGDAYTAGNVAGCVDLDIKGGNILGSIYGGGRLGSVGYGLYPPSAGETYYGAMRPDNTGDDANNIAIANFKRGYVDVEISGGTIGNTHEYIIPNANNTPTGLNIANIASWTDANWKTWKTHNNIPLTEFDTETYRLKHTKGGNVFAGGMGRLYQLDGKTPISAVNWWKVGCVKQTTLTVKGGTIKSNVYGGGELGAVKPYVNGNTVEGGNTEVIVQNANTTQIGTEIKDGSSVTQYTFGSVYGGGYGSTIEKLNVTNTENDNPKFVAGLVHGDTKIDMRGGKVLASVYGGGEVASVNGSADVAVSGGEVGKDKVGDKQFGGATMGNVYGGGSGHPNIVRCGRILKNTKVTISGTDTKIYHNVYGGGAYGTVGEFTYTTGNDGKVTGVTGLKTAGTGTAEVIITGGTIGTDGHENGMIFGSSRGDVNEPGARDDHTAWVYDAKVTIGTSNSETGPLVKGSVYGSGENGHTFNDAIVNIYSGTVGITDTDIDGGARYNYRGNVYGGGCGTDIYDKGGKRRYNPLAGIVYGTTTVNMTGGHVVHDVFGGGAMGSVGKFTFNDNGKPTGIVQGAATNSGKCTLNISGGKIGMTGMQMTATGGPDDYGHVFGAGRGEVKDTTVYDNLNVTGYVNSTEVNISGTAFVTGSVYGGAESGHVLGNTLVQVSGGQIGCGVGKTVAYTADEWAAASPSTLAPCASWTYTANGNGAPYDPNAGAANYDSKGGRTTATDGHTFYGNVFGGGSGYYQYSPGIWIRSAGRVEGNTSVVISGGHILSNVYGGNECTDVFGSATISMTGGTVGVPRTQTQIESNPVLGHIYGGGKGDKRVLFNTWTNVASTSVSLTGGKVYGSVYGGGEDGHVLGNAVTTINGAGLVIGCDGTSGYDGNVFGGGQGSSTALTAGVVGGNVTLNIQDGTMKGSVYGGGRLAAVGTHFENPDGDNYGELHSDNPTDHGNISVNLTGGTIHQDVFGGGMGVTNVDNADRFAISRNVTVHLNEGLETTAKGCIVKGRIFGANNANASPKGDVLVHIHATQNEGTNNIATKASDYDVSYVFGGGNNADYVPATDNEKQSTEVIIEGCDLTSIEEVYGGGYGAATPGTKVEIRGTKIINNVFGGGYGAGENNPGANVGIKTDGTTAYGLNTDDNKYKTAVVRLMAGTVNNVYGGSNTNGNIRGGSSITNVPTEWTQGDYAACCPNLKVGEIYGGGKSAPMEGGAEIVLGCMPNDWIGEIYAGAQAANVGHDVSLTLTSGKFERVFGGNNVSGTIDGSIEVNIEECPTCDTPIIIGELYGGGNMASYTVPASYTADDPEYKSPRVNVRSFTSIGTIYGGGYGSSATVNGNPLVNINVGMVKGGGKAYDGAAKAGDLDVTLYPHVQNKIGVIGNVFGGGNAAPVNGNTYVNIGTQEYEVLAGVIVGETDVSDYYTQSGDGPSYTYTKASESAGTAVAGNKAKEGIVYFMPVVGADIRGNVFGGGNNAAVTGDSHVTIGKRE